MFLGISSKSTLQTVSVVKTTRTLAVIVSVTVAAYVLFDADPSHRYATACLTSAKNWLHAAFNI